MPSLFERITTLLKERTGLSDREITDKLVGPGAAQQPVNQACRNLQSRGVVVRKKRNDGRIANYLSDHEPVSEPPRREESPDANGDPLSEDSIKVVLVGWLDSHGWKTRVAWGRTRGIDVDAQRGRERWIIEVKGRGSRSAMRVNYFLAVLGELLQRMDDPEARYSIALPDLPQFRGLWRRLPALVKSRNTITALFVDADGNVEAMETS